MIPRLFLASITVTALSCEAFVAPGQLISTFRLHEHASGSNSCLNDSKLPFFASLGTDKKVEEPKSEKSDDDELESMVREEVIKTKRMAKFKNEKGVEYAPWMQLSEKEEEEIRQIIKEKKRIRDKRREEQRKASGNLYYDSTAQELSGTGLKAKVIDENNVELQWGTKSEVDCKGFIVRRRAAKAEDFETLASYENYGPLVSKGPEGGTYKFLDTTASPGGWFYRISEKTSTGEESDLSQCLVEIQTEDEQKFTLAATVGIALTVVLAIVAGISIDPIQ